MRRMCASLLAILVVVAVPTELVAKGDTVRIKIEGGDLIAPIQIADPNVIGPFNVWMGPGTSSNERQGFLVDWSRGVAKPPKDLPVYRILIVTSRRNPGTYVVRYVHDATMNEDTYTSRARRTRNIETTLGSFTVESKVTGFMLGANGGRWPIR